MMSDAELREWMDLNSMLCSDNINIVAPLTLTENFYETWLPKFIPAITKIEFLEAYKGKGKESKITLRITYKHLISIFAIKSHIEEFISEITQ